MTRTGIPARPHPLGALVLCGGGGTRLWPLSTEARPKQFLRLAGDETLFQATVRRLDSLGVDRTVIVTNAALEQLARADLEAMDRHEGAFVLEPARRDSAPAIAAGVAALRADLGEDALALVLPSDHLIPDHAAFASLIETGIAAARQDRLVTFGIRPTRPATEYGYIQRGDALPGLDGVFAVTKFHEKPGIDKASAYLADPRFAWNAGIFLFRVGAFAAEAEAHMPDIWAAAVAAVEGASGGAERRELAAGPFGEARRISIDFALFERSRRVAVVPAGLLWSDIGAWGAVYEAATPGPDGLVTRGEVVASECSNALIVAEGLPVLGVGLENMVVIASPEGVFIAPRNRTQDIKAMLDRLAAGRKGP